MWLDMIRRGHGFGVDYCLGGRAPGRMDIIGVMYLNIAHNCNKDNHNFECCWDLHDRPSPHQVVSF